MPGHTEKNSDHHGHDDHGCLEEAKTACADMHSLPRNDPNVMKCAQNLCKSKYESEGE
jgi:hypothetical protein